MKIWGPLFKREVAFGMLMSCMIYDARFCVFLRLFGESKPRYALAQLVLSWSTDAFYGKKRKRCRTINAGEIIPPCHAKSNLHKNQSLQFFLCFFASRKNRTNDFKGRAASTGKGRLKREREREPNQRGPFLSLAISGFLFSQTK